VNKKEHTRARKKNKQLSKLTQNRNATNRVTTYDTSKLINHPQVYPHAERNSKPTTNKPKNEARKQPKVVNKLFTRPERQRLGCYSTTRDSRMQEKKVVRGLFFIKELDRENIDHSCESKQSTCEETTTGERPLLGSAVGFS
jgi:hypothetical protein